MSLIGQHLHDANLPIARQHLDAIDLSLADRQRLNRKHLAFGFPLRLRDGLLRADFPRTRRLVGADEQQTEATGD